MLEPYRSQFNAAFQPADYARLLDALEANTGDRVEFRVCETPCFFPRSLLDDMAAAGREMTLALTRSDYINASNAAVPDRYRVPNDNPQPNFMTVDFGFIRNEDGTLGFKLVELQAFPSIYGYQDLLSRLYVETFGLPKDLRWHLGGHNSASYWEMLRRVIVGGHDPETVVLLEVTPELQKTRTDFRIYERQLGIATVDIAKVHKVGSKLYYKAAGRDIPISRIYNRAIVDEIEREGITPGFDHRDDLRDRMGGPP